MTTLPNTVKLTPLLLTLLLLGGVMMIAPITTQAQMTTWGSVPTYACEGQGASVKVNSRIGRYGLDKGSRSFKKVDVVRRNIISFSVKGYKPPLFPLETSLNLFSTFEDGGEMVGERDMLAFTRTKDSFSSTVSSTHPTYNKANIEVDIMISFIRQQLSNRYGGPREFLFTKIPSKVYAIEGLTRGEAVLAVKKLPTGDHVLLLWWDKTKPIPTPTVAVLFKDLDNKLRLFDPSLSGTGFKGAYEHDVFDLRGSNPFGVKGKNYLFTIFGINRDIASSSSTEPGTIPPDKQGGAGPGPYNP